MEAPFVDIGGGEGNVLSRQSFDFPKHLSAGLFGWLLFESPLGQSADVVKSVGERFFFFSKIF